MTELAISSFCLTHDSVPWQDSYQMPKRSSNTPDRDSSGDQVEPREKDPHAVELGRRGGRIGGRARAESLTPQQRSDIARKAAAKRWETRANDAVEAEHGVQRKRARVNERLREAFAAGAEEQSRQSAGRGLTPDELDRVLRQYPGHDGGDEQGS